MDIEEQAIRFLFQSEPEKTFGAPEIVKTLGLRGAREGREASAPTVARDGAQRGFGGEAPRPLPRRRGLGRPHRHAPHDAQRRGHRDGRGDGPAGLRGEPRRRPRHPGRPCDGGLPSRRPHRPRRRHPLHRRGGRARRGRHRAPRGRRRPRRLAAQPHLPERLHVGGRVEGREARRPRGGADAPQRLGPRRTPGGRGARGHRPRGQAFAGHRRHPAPVRAAGGLSPCRDGRGRAGGRPFARAGRAPGSARPLHPHHRPGNGARLRRRHQPGA